MMRAATLAVLVVTEANGFVHDSIPAATQAVRDLARPAQTTVVGARELTAARLDRADAVVFVSTTGNLPFSIPVLRAWVRDGGAVVGLHAASNAFPSRRLQPQWERLLGGIFKSHPHVGRRTVRVTDRRHPAMRGLPRRFALDDEFYEFRTSPRRRAHVLLRREGRGDHPLVWCRREGRGRVFYSALGHHVRNWSERRHRAIVRGGLRWALSDGPCNRRATGRVTVNGA
jgi:type 1 glutamine amidotransferase